MGTKPNKGNYISSSQGDMKGLIDEEVKRMAAKSFPKKLRNLEYAQALKRINMFDDKVQQKKEKILHKRKNFDEISPNNPSDYKFKFSDDVNLFFEKRFRKIRHEFHYQKPTPKSSDKNIGEAYAQHLLQVGIIPDSDSRND
mmetsp:Transcript_8930/g.7893  ORF Transcript_8930/g.7893 Transcript_8930/m.7893 type:complete len:142 (-) Transcript_8930:68-493(-)